MLFHVGALVMFKRAYVQLCLFVKNVLIRGKWI